MKLRWPTIAGLALAVVVAGCVADDEHLVASASNAPAKEVAKVDPPAPESDPAIAAPTILPMAPDLTFTSLAGKKISLPELSGKVVYLDFWAPWCPPCRAGLPFTQRLNDAFRKKGLVVMAISDDPRKSVTKFVEGNHYTFPTYLDQGTGAKTFGFDGIPYSVVIDRTGHVVAEEMGLVSQAETIHNLASAGLDMSGFEPKNDPLLRQPSG